MMIKTSAAKDIISVDLRYKTDSGYITMLGYGSYEVENPTGAACLEDWMSGALIIQLEVFREKELLTQLEHESLIIYLADLARDRCRYQPSLDD